MLPLIEYLRRRRARRLIQVGNKARNRRDWPTAAMAYSRALGATPRRADIHVQLGHAFKEGGEREKAEISYRNALAIEPKNSDSWLQLGHVLKLLSRIKEAEEAYCQALVNDPDFEPAKRELVGLGAAYKLLILGINVEPLLGDSEIGFPFLEYNSFRKRYCIPPTPAVSHNTGFVHVVINAIGCMAADLRITIDSIRSQNVSSWRLTVIVDEHIISHPLVSLSSIDYRIMFSCDDLIDFFGKNILFLRPGVTLGSSSIAWFVYASHATSCAACYCDHDYAICGWQMPVYHSPVLQPSFDRHWFSDSSVSPPVVFFPEGLPAVWRDKPLSSILAGIAQDGGKVVHLPLLLASVADLVSRVTEAPRDGDVMYECNLPICEPSLVNSDVVQRIAVIIPTRDHFSLLERAISTVVERASRPELVDFIVVDNRSSESATLVGFEELHRRYGAHVIKMDEPFNWSRANNIAVKNTQSELLVFMNNDMEMLSFGWDDRLRFQLSSSDVGIVGARLLYPDRTLQHGGIVFGFGRGSPMHEGVGVAETNAGPNGRWLRVREASAVTGAFMALKRSLWAEVGGFDEVGLALSYNDVDFCLSARSVGKSVIYDPFVLLVHFESKTRGMTVTRSQVAWDNLELKALADRWGEGLFRERGANPHWKRDEDPFTYLCVPDASVIEEYLVSQ